MDCDLNNERIEEQPGLLAWRARRSWRQSHRFPAQSTFLLSPTTASLLWRVSGLSLSDRVRTSVQAGWGGFWSGCFLSEVFVQDDGRDPGTDVWTSLGPDKRQKISGWMNSWMDIVRLARAFSLFIVRLSESTANHTLWQTCSACKLFCCNSQNEFRLGSLSFWCISVMI